MSKQEQDWNYRCVCGEVFSQLDHTVCPKCYTHPGFPQRPKIDGYIPPPSMTGTRPVSVSLPMSKQSEKTAEEIVRERLDSVELIDEGGWFRIYGLYNGTNELVGHGETKEKAWEDAERNTRTAPAGEQPSVPCNYYNRAEEARTMHGCSACNRFAANAVVEEETYTPTEPEVFAHFKKPQPSAAQADLPPLNSDSTVRWSYGGQSYKPQFIVSADAFAERERQLANALRRIAEVEGANRWIPCSERMPEGLGTCLCVHSNGATLAATQVFYKGIWVDSTNPNQTPYRMEDITHWRPLPPAPSEAKG